MAKVFVEADPEAFDLIAGALRSAGLSTVDIERVIRPREVTQFPAAPGNWAAFADLAPELTYTEWREEVLSLVDAEEPATLRSALSLCETIVTDLRRAG
jgi:hypothetical protein